MWTFYKKKCTLVRMGEFEKSIEELWTLEYTARDAEKAFWAASDRLLGTKAVRAEDIAAVWGCGTATALKYCAHYRHQQERTRRQPLEWLGESLDQGYDKT